MSSYTTLSIISKISEDGQPYSSPCFVQAKLFWEEFFKEHCNEDVAELSRSLSFVQGRFCSIFPDYLFAKEVMAATAISYIHDQTNGNGFWKDPNGLYYEEKCALLAKKVIEAFSNSDTSVEVKMSAPKLNDLFDSE